MSGRLDATPAEPPADDQGLFVIRWRRRPEAERIEVEHVQSRTRIRVSSAARALSWMRRRLAGTPDPDAEPPNGEPPDDPQAA